MLIILQGFDEYMNLILDDAEEVNLKTAARRKVGEFHDTFVPCAVHLRRTRAFMYLCLFYVNELAFAAYLLHPDGWARCGFVLYCRAGMLHRYSLFTPNVVG